MIHADSFRGGHKFLHAAPSPSAAVWAGPVERAVRVTPSDGAKGKGRRCLEIQVLAGLAGALERLLGCRRSRRRLWRLVLLFRWSLCRLRLLIQLDPDAVSRRSWLVRPLQLDWRSVGLARLLGRLEHVAWGRRSARNLQVLPYRLLLLLLRLLA